MNCREPTREELLQTRKISLQVALNLNRREAAGAASEARRSCGISGGTDASYSAEGGRHFLVAHPIQNKRFAAPRHKEIDDDLARKICRMSALRRSGELRSGQPCASGHFEIEVGDVVVRTEGITLYGYAVVQVWAQAVEKAGAFDVAAVVEALRHNEFDTVLGRLGFDDKGDVTARIVARYVWSDSGYIRRRSELASSHPHRGTSERRKLEALKWASVCRTSTWALAPPRYRKGPPGVLQAPGAASPLPQTASLPVLRRCSA